MPTKNIPAVSIIIPMYNTEKYIGECLDSILAQTFTDYEVIVVDDCSTDNSRAIVESYLPKFDTGGGGRNFNFFVAKIIPVIPANRLTPEYLFRGANIFFCWTVTI